jgi:hypothetical protein
VDDRLGRGEGVGADLPAEVLAPPERDVEAELLVEEDGADRLDAERREDAEAELGEVRVGGLLREERRLPLRLGAAREDLDGAVPLDAVADDLLPNWTGRTPSERLGSPSTSPS